MLRCADCAYIFALTEENIEILENYVELRSIRRNKVCVPCVQNAVEIVEGIL